MRTSVDVEPKHKRINVFTVGKLWLFKHFFDNRDLFEALLDYYKIESIPPRVQVDWREEQCSQATRAKWPRLRPGGGPERLRGQTPKIREVCQILKISVATKETMTERIFLMKDLAAVEEAVSLGAKIVEGEVAF